MDGPRGRRSHRHTVALREALSTSDLWTNYGIVNGIMVRFLSCFIQNVYPIYYTAIYRSFSTR